MTINSPAAPPRLKVLAAFAAIYLIWGSTYLAIRFAIDTIPPFLMAGWRFLIAGGLLYGWLRIRGVPPPQRIHWRSGVIIGGLMLLGGNGGVTWAEQHVPSGLAALLIATVPLWMVLLEWVRPSGRRPALAVLIGVAVGLAGVVLLIDPANLGGSRVDPLGAGVLVLAALSWSIGSLYSREAPLPEPQMMSTALEMLGGGALLVLLGTASGEWARLDLAGISTRSALAMAYLVVFGSLIGFSAYIWLLKVSTPARASTYAYVNPVVAVLLGWLLGGEPISGLMLLAAAIIIGAVVLITAYRTRPIPAVSPGSAD
ncbi:MAG: drug/metabolite exporter YedA [Anaerolineae bacterium]